MGLGRLRRFDVQANYALVLAVISLAPLLAAAWLLLTRYNPDLVQVVYGAQGRFLAAFFGCVLLSMIPATIGFLLGWSSSGQRRNDKPVRAWIGFFLGGIVVTADIILVIAFIMLRFKHPM